MVIGYLSACQILTCKPVLDMNKITQVSQLLCSRLVRGTIDNVRRFCIYFADKVQLDTLSTKVRLVKAMVFPVVMYGCES